MGKNAQKMGKIVQNWGKCFCLNLGKLHTTGENLQTNGEVCEKMGNFAQNEKKYTKNGTNFLRFFLG